MKKLLPISLFLMVLFFSSCDQKPDVSAYNEIFQQIIKTDEGHFRGISIGDEITTVKKAESGELIEEEPDYLFYDVEIDKNNYYNMAYYFDNTGLYEIRFDGTFEKKSMAAEIFTSFHDYYTRQFGDPEIEEGYYIWKTKSDKSKHIEIALIKHNIDAHGEEMEEGYISLTISNFDY